MKKMIMIAMAMLFLATPAFAATTTVNWVDDATHEAYTVGSYGSTAPQSDFTRNETPWLYVKLPSYTLTGGNNKVDDLYLRDKWNFGTRTIVDATLSGIPTGGTFSSTLTPPTEYWVSPTNWSTDPSFHNQVGTWEIYDIFYQFRRSGTEKQEGSFTGNGGVVNFNVVPEPVSMVLFGLGAGVLGLAQLRRKKK
jgi:hypothetical protein